MENTLPKLSILVVILNKDKGRKMIKILQEKISCYQFATIGYGTADKAMHDYFGLSQTTKEIIFSIVEKTKASKLLQILEDNFSLSKHNTGLAFTVPLDSISSVKAMQYILCGQKED